MSAQGIMALQKFTLPRLKLTHRPAFGKKSVGIVPREVVANETLELSEEGASTFCSMMGLVQSMRWWSLQVMSWRVDLLLKDGRQ